MIRCWGNGLCIPTQEAFRHNVRVIDRLTTRQLNRATLARQLLLERADYSAERVLQHLVGMQSQAPLAPYVGLWTRVVDFRADELSALMIERRAVRASLMRATIHLVTAADFLELWPVLELVSERGLWTGSPFGRRVPRGMVKRPAGIRAGPSPRGAAHPG